MSVIFYSSYPSVSITAGRLVWGIVGVIVTVRRAVTLASLLGFLLKFEVIVSKVRDWNSFPGWYPPTSKRGDFVDSFCTDVNISGSFSINACKSLSLSNFAFTASDIALLHKSSGLTESCSGTVKQ